MFAENLIQLRKLNQMSQDELADQIGVSRQTLSKYETGESLPDIERCKRLADIFGVTVDDLINYEKRNIVLLIRSVWMRHTVQSVSVPAGQRKRKT